MCACGFRSYDIAMGVPPSSKAREGDSGRAAQVSAFGGPGEVLSSMSYQYGDL